MEKTINLVDISATPIVPLLNIFELRAIEPNSTLAPTFDSTLRRDR